MAILIPIAFVVGVVTAFTPCVLPVLPIILAGGTSSENRRRPYAIIAGLVTTFTLFTLAGAWIWSELHVPARYQLRIGAGLLFFVALTLVIPQLARWVERPFLFLTRRRARDTGGGFVLGAGLGIVFVPCTGPLLGALLTNVGSHRVGAWTVFVLLFFALGASLPLLLIAQGSRRVTASLRRHAQTVRIASAVLMAGFAVVIANNWLESVQRNTPSFAVRFERWLEGGGTAKSALSDLRHQHATLASGSSSLANVPLGNLGSAPNFHGISHWLNTPGLSLQALRGKVVLVDFWTYSCINCLRTLPHLEEWDKQYRDKGLVIVGVHTPEFAFEHDLSNVRRAVKSLGVRYPVALDNDYATWNAYSNEYWPAEYLIDQNGEVRHVHFGEGSYGETEKAIRLLLAAGGHSKLPAPHPERDTTPSGVLTPESYLGYYRMQRYVGLPIARDKEATYRFPRTLGPDELSYAGRWRVGSEQIVAGAGARLRLHFQAHDVHLVLGGQGAVRVHVDGKALADVHVDGPRLYTLATFPHTRDGLLELAFTPGIQAYAFTFG